MGNAFPVSGFEYKNNPDIIPRHDTESKFDPLKGFPNGRVAKVMPVSEEELYSAKVPLQDRDYCSDLLLKFYTCRRQNFPMISNCHHERHAYLHCQYEEYVDRMKEYEREKRLLLKEKKAAAA